MLDETAMPIPRDPEPAPGIDPTRDSGSAPAPNQNAEPSGMHTQNAIQSMPVYMREHVLKYSHMAARLSEYRKKKPKRTGN